MSNYRNRKKPRPTARLNASLDRSLAAYVTAASAAGVAMLSISQPAQAKVVYTAANVNFGHNGSVELDLNNDGIPDFKLFDFYSQPIRVPLGYRYDDLEIEGLTKGNAVCDARSNGQSFVAALPARVQVGPDCGLVAASATQLVAYSAGSYSTAAVKGPWAARPNAYVGVKFLIHGMTHYGWVRISVGENINNVTVVGYAYETVPNKTISTGQTTGPVKVNAQNSTHGSSMKAPSTLGLLACGADGLAAWRRDVELTADDRGDVCA